MLLFYSFSVSPTVMLCPAVSLHLRKHNTKLGASLKNLWCAPEFVPSTSNPCRRLCFFVHYWAVLRTPWEQTTSLVVLSLASIRKFALNTSAISIIMISQQQCPLLIGSTALMTHTTVWPVMYASLKFFEIIHVSGQARECSIIRTVLSKPANLNGFTNSRV